MNWYVTKIVYQIICGQGRHTAQFDEQIRLICAADEEQAFAKAVQIGHSEADSFCNAKREMVQWNFINVAELYRLNHLTDGAEIYSRITEADEEAAYVHAVHQKAASLQEKTTNRRLHLI
jgi:hypothetical protein